MIRVIVVSELCSSVILGLPFLAANSLLIDAEDRTLVDKHLHINILAPGFPLPDIRSPKQRCTDTQRRPTQALNRINSDRKIVIDKLKVRFIADKIARHRCDWPHVKSA